jgi:hypothetical protein
VVTEAATSISYGIYTPTDIPTTLITGIPTSLLESKTQRNRLSTSMEPNRGTLSLVSTHQTIPTGSNTGSVNPTAVSSSQSIKSSQSFSYDPSTSTSSSSSTGVAVVPVPTGAPTTSPSPTQSKSNNSPALPPPAVAGIAAGAGTAALLALFAAGFLARRYYLARVAKRQANAIYPEVAYLYDPPIPRRIGGGSAGASYETLGSGSGNRSPSPFGGAFGANTAYGGAAGVAAGLGGPGAAGDQATAGFAGASAVGGPLETSAGQAAGSARAAASTAGPSTATAAGLGLAGLAMPLSNSRYFRHSSIDSSNMASLPYAYAATAVPNTNANTSERDALLSSPNPTVRTNGTVPTIPTTVNSTPTLHYPNTPPGHLAPVRYRPADTVIGGGEAAVPLIAEPERSRSRSRSRSPPAPYSDEAGDLGTSNLTPQSGNPMGDRRSRRRSEMGFADPRLVGREF